MSEIILSFFAVIGITLLAIRICDYFFYRKFSLNAPLILNLNGKTEEEIIEILELIATVRQKESGKAVLSELIIFVSREDHSARELVYHYLKVFDLNGTVYFSGDEQWKDRF